MKWSDEIQDYRLAGLILLLRIAQAAIRARDGYCDSRIHEKVDDPRIGHRAEATTYRHNRSSKT